MEKIQCQARDRSKWLRDRPPPVTLLPVRVSVQHVDQMLSWPSAGLLSVVYSIVHPLTRYSELPRTGQ